MNTFLMIDNVDITGFQNFTSNEVMIGNIPLGGKNPIRIQSMTNTDTNNIEKSVAQCVDLYNAGADYVRLTVQGLREVDSMLKIQDKLKKQNINIPLIADVHFNPKVAEKAARYFAKVRINPGNYSEKRRGKIEFTNEEYEEEIKKIKINLLPLLNICKENKSVLRIGINHGSLSERIMSRFGDTPEGMVESAMEFLRFCRDEKFFNVVVSMKSSNVLVMVQSTRLLVLKMNEEGMHFPLHLGVTEAGEGEDGRIKSAIGIGTLLNDGIGDTIRVSLTENPVNEIPVAQKIVEYCSTDEKTIIKDEKIYYNPYNYKKRQTQSVFNIGGNNNPVVIAQFNTNKDILTVDQKPDYLFIDNWNDSIDYLKENKIILKYEDWKTHAIKFNNIYPLFLKQQFLSSDTISNKINFIKVKDNECDEIFLSDINNKNVVLILENTNNTYTKLRAFFNNLLRLNIYIPVIIFKAFEDCNLQDIQIKSACQIGSLFIDGFGDGIFLKNKGGVLFNQVLSTSFSLLQASRARITKTEYISCPGCGRTLFNLEETVQKIKKKTSHLKGLKIGIMGCIVNGPGEMTDADYGYVGAGKGKITLYKNKEAIKKNIPSENAVNELIELIKQNGDWVDC